MENVKNKKQLVIIAAMFVFVLALICACTNATTAQAKVKKPGRAKIASVKFVNTYKVKVTVKKVKKAKGYQVKIATNKQFTKNFKTKTSKAKTKTFSIAKTSSTQRYIKARAYKKSHGKIIYGKWSKVKTVAALKLPTNNNADEEQINDENYREMTEQELFELRKPNYIAECNLLYQYVKFTDYSYPAFNDWDIVTYAYEKKEQAILDIKNATNDDECENILNTLNKDFKSNIVGFDYTK